MGDVDDAIRRGELIRLGPPIGSATQKDLRDLIKACYSNDVANVYPRLRKDLIDATARTRKGEHVNALYIAIKKGNLDMVNCLIGNSCNVNIIYENGITPIILAVSCRFHPIALVLAESGADVYAKDDYGRSCIDLLHSDQEEIMLHEAARIYKLRIADEYEQ